jgi:hypothetical protein
MLPQLGNHTKEQQMKVNLDYDCGLYDDGEVFIQTTPESLAINGGRIYLTVRELKALLALTGFPYCCTYHESGGNRDLSCGGDEYRRD